MDDRVQQHTDELLISMIRSGSTTAVTELVTRYLPLIRYKAAGYRLPGMEPDDVVQEGLLGLLKAISLYQADKSSFSTYVSICVASSLATAAKSALSPKSMPLRNYAPLSEGEICTAADPAQSIISAEQLNGLRQRINTLLSPLEQQTLNLYLTGHSYLEISSFLSTTSKAVDNALQRVRRKLRVVE